MKKIGESLVGYIILGIVLIGALVYILSQSMTNKHLVNSCTEQITSTSVKTWREVDSDEGDHAFGDIDTRYKYYAEYTYMVNGVEYKNKQLISESLYNTLEETKVIDNILYNPSKASESYIEGSLIVRGFTGQLIYISPILILIGVIVIRKIFRKEKFEY